MPGGTSDPKPESHAMDLPATECQRMLYEGTSNLEAPKPDAALNESEARPQKQLGTMTSGVGAADRLSFSNSFWFCGRGTKVKRLSRSEAIERPLGFLVTS